MSARSKIGRPDRRKSKIKTPQSTLHRQVKSYHTFPTTDFTSSLESIRSNPTTAREVRSASLVAETTSDSSTEKELKSNTSRLTLDHILHYQPPQQTQHSEPLGHSSAKLTDSSSEESLQRTRRSNPFPRRMESSSPTYSTDEADNIQASTAPSNAPQPLLHNPPNINNIVPPIQENPPLCNRWCLGRSFFKIFMCGIFISSAVLYAISFGLLHLDKSITDIIILPSNESFVAVKKASVENTSDFTILLEAIKFQGPPNEILIDLEVPPGFHCEHRNIIAKNISKWKHNPHYALLHCLHIFEESTETMAINLTNLANDTISLALDIDIRSTNWAYFAAVISIIVLMQVALHTEFVKPLAVVVVSAMVSTSLQSVCEVQVGVAWSSDITSMAPGCILEQILLISGLMVIVNFLIHCGFYSSLTYRISASAKYRWRRVVAVVLILATTLSALCGRITAIQLIVPLAICVADAYHLKGGMLVTAIVILINVSNLLCQLGNDAMAEMHGVEFHSVNLFENNGILAGFTPLVGAFTVLFTCTVLYLVATWLDNLEESNTETYTRDVYKARILYNWKAMVLPLTKADVACLQFAEEAHRSLDEALRNPQNITGNRVVTDAADEQRFLSMYIKANYYMNDWHSFWYCLPITCLTLMAIPAVRWINWDTGVEITPGLVAITAAVCLFIISNSEEKTIRSINWSVLLFIVLYRYTIQTLLSGTVLDYIGYIYEQIDTEHYGLGQLGLYSCVMWFSGLLSTFVGVENISPDMLIIYGELYALNSENRMLLTCIFCQIVGATLSANALLYSSVGNVIAKGSAAEHGITLTPLTFLKLGVPVTIMTMLVGNTVILFTQI